MKILVFGGTTEGRDMATALAEAGADVTVSVATEYGGREQSGEEEIKVVTGARDEEEMEQLLKDFDLCVDATHPFATEASANIKGAADRVGIKLIRVLREDEAGETREAKVTFVDSPGEAAEAVKAMAADARAMGPDTKAMAAEAKAMAAEKSFRVLLTTGAKDLATYAKMLDPESLFPRVLPLASSLEACEKAGIPVKNIIAAQGPFGMDFNEGTIRNYDIDVLITKQSGKSGGYEEKIRACRNCGIRAVVIRRPAEEGTTLPRALELCNKLLEQEQSL